MASAAVTRVAVIGAGVAGLACATELTARGADVTVYERGHGIGAHSCSWYAGGMLAPWCEGESAEQPVVRLGQEAIDWWRRHTDCVTGNGSLVLAGRRDLTQLKQFAGRTERYQWVNEAAIAALEPDLAGRFCRGLLFADEAHLDPRLALRSLVRGLEWNNAALRFGESADSATLAAHANFDRVVDCRGLTASDTLPDLRGVKGEMLVIRSREVSLSRPVRLLHPRFPLYIVPRDDGHYMIGATMIESAERSRVSVRSMLELLGAAYALHPALAEAEVVETGADARPAFADNLPRLRRRGRTLLVNGLFRHGYLLAPALARMAADSILAVPAAAAPVPEVVDEYCP